MSDQNAVVAADQAPEAVNQVDQTKPTDVAEVAAPPAEQAEDTPDKRDRGAERRITRLIRKNAELAAKAEYLEREMQSRSKPDQDDGGKDVNIEELVERKLAEREHQSRIQTIEKKRDSIFAEASKDGDFDAEDFLESTEITPVMAEAILESDLAPKVVKFLYNNPEEAERIADLPAARQAAEIGKLEAKLSSAPAPKKTGAPAPIKPLNGGKTGDLEFRPDMTDEEYDKWTESERKKLYGR